MLTPEHVIWAYRLFLDRDPEDEVAVEHKLRSWRTTRELRTDFMSAPEFRSANRDMAYTSESNVVITEIAEQLRLFVDLSDYVVGLNIIRGGYESGEIAFVRQVVKPGQTVLDIGANIGFYTIILASLVGASGKVYAFEPMEKNAHLLAQSIAENSFEQRVKLERVLVGETIRRAQLVFAQHTLTSGGAHLFDDQMELLPGHSLNSVPMVTLDSYELGAPVAFIKIDVEGAEPLVFRGAERLLRNDRPLILSELHPEQLLRVSRCTPAEFITEMRGRGYNCYLLEDGTMVRQIADGDQEQIWSVVFVPEDERDMQPLAQIVANQARMLREQSETIEALRAELEQREAQTRDLEAHIHDLEERARWLTAQAVTARRNLAAVEQGRVLRLMRWLQGS